MAVKKTSSQVKTLDGLFGDSNFADILNRLWVTGLKVDDLKVALATTKEGTNDRTDIITRLLNSGKVTEDQLKAAAAIQPPNIAANVYPFHPESQKDGIVIPTSMSDYSAVTPSGAFGEVNYPGTDPYIYRGDIKLPSKAPAQTNVTPISPPANTTPTTTTIAAAPGNTNKEKLPVSEADIAKYEAEHYGEMLWVNDVPELKDLLKKAATSGYSLERFTSELHSTDWWKTHDDNVRAYTVLQSDPAKLKSEVAGRASLLKDYATQFGVNLDDATLEAMGHDWLRFGWDKHPELAKRAVIGKAQNLGAEQGGQLGAWETKAKSYGKQFLTNISDDEAWDWAQKLAGGQVTEENLTESLRQRAKGAYPSIADYIENGGTPRNYFAEHINTAAKLLEVDANTIDLTDPKFNSIISYAGQDGKIRPMTVSETSKFIKQKDEYWQTSNANNEVSSLLNSLGQTFGKVGI